jgi:hypothetical protein
MLPRGQQEPQQGGMGSLPSWAIGFTALKIIAFAHAIP